MRRSRRIAVVVAVVAASVAGPALVASAHPLGNFTVNTSASLVVRTDEIAIGYVVDMAEIPAFRERRTIDVDGDGTIHAIEAMVYVGASCAGVAERIDLAIGDASVEVMDRGTGSVTFPAGAGGLMTLRLTCELGAAIPAPIGTDAPIDLSVDDRNHPEALGWREVSAVGDGVTLVRSDVPTSSSTDSLRSYPREELPLDVRSASLRVVGGGPPLTMDPSGADPTPSARSTDGGILASLIGRTDVTPSLIVLMILVALGVGALHALGPGHGKTLIGAYLVAGGGTMRHAIGVGVAVSLMHTASVLALGAVVLGTERLVAPERVYPWLGIAAGAIAIVLGSVLLRSRARSLGTRDPHERDLRAHAHAHRVGDPHAATPVSSRGLLALAFSGGALPSPTALIAFLGAVSVGRAALGLALIAAFSVGLAGALVAVGVLALGAREAAERKLSSRAMRLVPVASAAAIVAMGVVLAVRGAAQL